MWGSFSKFLLLWGVFKCRHPCESGFWLLNFREARGPYRDSCGNGDRSQQAGEQAGPVPTTEEPRPAAKFQAEDNISPGVYNPAEEEPIMKALHTLDTRTLLMSTALLISRGKYHSYFILSPLSQGATLRPSPPPVVGELGRCIPTKPWKSCSETSSRKPKGHLIKGPMEAWLGCPSSCSECRYMAMTFLEVQVGTC